MVAEDAAIIAVQHAFWQDTSDRNRRDSCSHAALSWLREQCEKHP